eukprot:SAG11_NODE_858_length_6850_cov_11.886535_3_plen_103_part_00
MRILAAPCVIDGVQPPERFEKREVKHSGTTEHDRPIATKASGSEATTDDLPPLGAPVTQILMRSPFGATRRRAAGRTEDGSPTSTAGRTEDEERIACAGAVR